MGDFSQNYTNDSKGMIFFALGNNKTSFKPFIDTFSFTFTNAVDNPKGNIFNKTLSIKEFKESKYTVSFNILATNVNESIENHKKFQKLIRMIMPQDAENLAVAKIVHVKFSNLISSKGQTGKNNMSAGQILNEGFEGIIRSLKYEPDMEMGFFEYNGMLFAKAFKINFDLTAIPKDNKSNVPTFRSGYNYGRVYADSNLPVQQETPPPPVTSSDGGSTITTALSGFIQAVSGIFGTNETNVETTNTADDASDPDSVLGDGPPR